MDFQSIDLSKEEIRRLREIADGDTVAKNTPEEDALFRAELVRESLMAFVCEDGTSTVDDRAVTLTKEGRAYMGWYTNKRREEIRDTVRFWIEIVLALAALVLPFILSES